MSLSRELRQLLLRFAIFGFRLPASGFRLRLPVPASGFG